MPFQVVLAFFLPPTHDPSLHLLTSPLLPLWPIPPGYIELCVTSTLLPPDSPISVFLCSVDPSMSFIFNHLGCFGDVDLTWSIYFVLFNTSHRMNYDINTVHWLIKSCRLLFIWAAAAFISFIYPVYTRKHMALQGSTVAKYIVNHRYCCKWLHTIRAKDTFCTGINNNTVSM